MLKHSVSYTDFNGDAQTEVLYFNLTKSEMLEMMDLLPRLEKWQELANGVSPDNTLTSQQVLDMVDIVKYLVEKSYGQRSEDGKKFYKSPGVYEDFKSMAVYDEFIFGLFEDPEKAVAFMSNIIPKDIPGMDNVVLPTSPTQLVELPQPESADPRPAYIREDREPTQRELANMSRGELEEAFRRKNSK